jgi:hypothetical protein
MSERVTEVMIPPGGAVPPPGGYLAAVAAAVAGELRQPADVALWDAEWELEPGDGDE